MILESFQDGWSAFVSRILLKMSTLQVESSWNEELISYAVSSAAFFILSASTHSAISCSVIRRLYQLLSSNASNLSSNVVYERSISGPKCAFHSLGLRWFIAFLCFVRNVNWFWFRVEDFLQCFLFLLRSQIIVSKVLKAGRLGFLREGIKSTLGVSLFKDGAFLHFSPKRCTSAKNNYYFL